MSTPTVPSILNDLLHVRNALNRDDFFLQIESLLGSSFIQKIDTHNTASVVYIFTENSLKYALKIEYGNATATEKEIDWYMHCSSACFLPRFIAGETLESHSFLILDYLENASSLDNLVNSGIYSSKEIQKFIIQAISFDRELFESSKPVRASQTELDHFYLDKYIQRMRESSAIRFLSELLQLEEISINDRTYTSIDSYIKRINNDDAIKKLLIPEKLGFIHGDLHGGNILVCRNKVFLIDPNGALYMPFEYDLGKVLHTVHGGYPAIMKGAFSLYCQDGHFIFDLQRDDAYTETYRHLQKTMNDTEHLRALYAEAMHFATMLPHHAKNKEETTALFLRTIELFDELCNNIFLE